MSGDVILVGRSSFSVTYGDKEGGSKMPRFVVT